MSDKYARFVDCLRPQADLAAALSLLEWDQETYMPEGAIDGRARQIGTLASLLHERQTDPRFVELVDELATRLDSLSPEQAVDVRETKWRLDRRRALDPELVRKRSELHAQARSVWIAARESGDFGLLAPYLQHIVDLEREVAGRIDPSRPPYDVLLEEFEPGATTDGLEQVLGQLRQGLKPLIDRLRARLERGAALSRALHGHFPIEAQKRFNLMVAVSLGFDLRKGRLDEAAHPFSTSLGDDHRITTRYDVSNLTYALYSTIHETGHALYEQGLDPTAFGLPRGQSCSLGIHESQSRLWENLIGRSEAFWHYLLPLAQEHFPSLQSVTAQEALQVVTDARPSLIRTESDEITYNMHIILRFELEQAMIDGRLAVSDLPQAWAEKMQEYLGIRPHDDRAGVLQDVHWASGAIGYFPTYSLGNVYAAQMLEAAEAAVGPLGPQIERGDFHPLLDWLRRNVHRRGQALRPEELVAAATGRTSSPKALLEHLGRRVEFLES
ncbi:MAG: carboxypeptidase M32 [Deltaproteobacteria bacterium]|nr:carboxypeptidase M32 [Deltaproteobacteria bacterium]